MKLQLELPAPIRIRHVFKRKSHIYLSLHFSLCHRFINGGIASNPQYLHLANS